MTAPAFELPARLEATEPPEARGLARDEVRLMVASRGDGGTIINVTSDAGIEAYDGGGGYGSSKAAFEQWTAVLGVERPHLRIYALDPGDMRTQMHQEAFPGEDISDRPLPEASVPGILALIDGDTPSGRYRVAHMHDGAPQQEVA